MATTLSEPDLSVPRARRMRAPVLVGVGGLALCVAIALHDPNEPGSWGACPFLAVTGHFCPGCGMLRAVHAILHGDVVGAAGFNPLLFVVAPVLTLLWAASTRRAWLGVPSRVAFPRWRLVAVGVLLGLFWVMRNLPGLEFLAPGS